MTLEEARELVASPLWEHVRDHVAEGHGFCVYPAGDLRRLEYVDAATRRLISHWCDATARMAEWKTVIDGKEVRKIRERFGDVYPEIFRYAPYFAKCENDQDRLRTVLRLKFPSVLEMVEK